MKKNVTDIIIVIYVHGPPGRRIIVSLSSSCVHIWMMMDGCSRSKCTSWNNHHSPMMVVVIVVVVRHVLVVVMMITNAAGRLVMMVAPTSLHHYRPIIISTWSL